MTGPAGPAWAIARSLGAVQEANRLDSRVVGTEHVLMAGFADPMVRSVFDAVDLEMRAVQLLVTRCSAERVARRPDDEPGVTPHAGRVLVGAARDPEKLDAGLPDGDISRALRQVVADLLSAENASAACRILDQLGARRHRDRLAGALRDTGAGRADLRLPSGTGPITLSTQRRS